jgi:hypothetical protein
MGKSNSPIASNDSLRAFLATLASGFQAVGDPYFSRSRIARRPWDTPVREYTAALEGARSCSSGWRAGNEEAKSGDASGSGLSYQLFSP